MAKLTPEDKQLLNELNEQHKVLNNTIQKAKSQLRFSASVVSKQLIKEEIKPYPKIAKVLKKSKVAYSLSEFQQLINEICDNIESSIHIAFVIEDTFSGDVYFFKDFELEPQVRLDLLIYLQYELREFPFVADAERLFIDMNRQYSEESNILTMLDDLSVLENEIKSIKNG